MAEPPAGSRGRALGQEPGSEAPWSRKPFSFWTSNGSGKICLILIGICSKLRIGHGKSKVRSNYFIVRQKVDQRAGQLSLPHLGNLFCFFCFNLNWFIWGHKVVTAQALDNACEQLVQDRTHSAAAGIELATCSRKSNALTTTPPSHTRYLRRHLQVVHDGAVVEKALRQKQNFGVPFHSCYVSGVSGVLALPPMQMSMFVVLQDDVAVTSLTLRCSRKNIHNPHYKSPSPHFLQTIRQKCPKNISDIERPKQSHERVHNSDAWSTAVQFPT